MLTYLYGQRDKILQTGFLKKEKVALHSQVEKSRGFKIENKNETSESLSKRGSLTDEFTHTTLGVFKMDIYTSTLTKQHKITGELVYVDLSGDKLKMVGFNGIIPNHLFEQIKKQSELHTEYLIISQNPKKIGEKESYKLTKKDLENKEYDLNRQKINDIMNY